MTGYELPVSVSLGGKEYPIRSDYRAVLRVLYGMSDPDLDGEGRALLLLKGMYPGWSNIPPDHIREAIEKANSFIDCGQEPQSGAPKPRTIDWEQDARLIVSAVNGVAHTEIRAMEYLHWWTFFSYFMEIGESLFSNVLHIRQKKASGKKLEKWERDFYKSNAQIIDIRRKLSAAEQAERESIERWLK